MTDAAGVYCRPLRAWIAVLGWMLVITALSVAPVADVPAVELPFGIDKWAHAAVYAPLTWLAAHAWRQSAASRRVAAIRGVALALAWGGTIEWVQAFVRREPSLGDWMADAVGATLGALVWLAWRGLREREAESR